MGGLPWWLRRCAEDRRRLPELLEDYRSVRVAPKGLKKPRKCSSSKLALRMFLRAYVRSEWGLDAEAMSYSELAIWLSDNGYSTNKHSVANAHRPNAVLVAHAVPNTEAVRRFTACILSRFPGFDIARLFVLEES